MQTDTLIVGGGLAGLSLALQLAERGVDFQLVEARDRLGGRILTQPHGDALFDMGPAWFWPGQPRIAAMIDRFDLNVFKQQWQGELMFEAASGQVQRGRGFASMQGSYRLDGGMGRLIEGLAKQLPPSRVHLSHPIQALEHTEHGINATAYDLPKITARQVVLALPPRLAARFRFTPQLPETAISAMREIATWMAGQAKAVAIYESAFWRDQGLSGDAMSQRGPLVEIHDASPVQGGPFALFGFIGVPPHRRTDEATLRAAIVAQLGHIFGPEARNPQNLFLHDWAFEDFTATDLDLQPLYTHPEYALPNALTGLWDNRLIFGGTEVAPQFGGYLEGALEAAEAALAILEMQSGV